MPKNMEWISVEDRLPEKYKKVAVLSNNKKNCQEYRRYVEWSGNQWTFFDYNGYGWKRNNITHWMPLPEPPKESTNAN